MNFHAVTQILGCLACAIYFVANYKNKLDINISFNKFVLKLKGSKKNMCFVTDSYFFNLNNLVRKSQNFKLYLKTWDISDFFGIALFHVSIGSSLRGLVLNDRDPSIYLTPLFCNKV